MLNPHGEHRLPRLTSAIGPVSRWISFSIAIDFSVIFLMLQSAREVTEPIGTLSQTPLYGLPARLQTVVIPNLKHAARFAEIGPRHAFDRQHGEPVGKLGQDLMGEIDGG